MICPLCHASDSEHVHQRTDKSYGRRDYYRCGRCRIIFLSPDQFLTPDQERARYDLHQNHPEDHGYVDFLNQLIEPLSKLLPAGARGLDYGCGPGPTASVLLRRLGFETLVYDPVYYPEDDLLQASYDFVTCTETVEHFYQPRREWERFAQLVKREGGLLGIMTGMYRDVDSFRDWWYHREPTHVNFYHADTWPWIATEWGWRVLHQTERVVILSH
ncbi:MAG: class I SAM-dependent methyltransferase [Candidatus Omnitrophica bacterium]|nr:class I SAM-dependent methyltransferase [Candidatus Omnitrophota bacterium]